MLPAAARGESVPLMAAVAGRDGLRTEAAAPTAGRVDRGDVDAECSDCRIECDGRQCKYERNVSGTVAPERSAGRIRI